MTRSHRFRHKALGVALGALVGLLPTAGFAADANPCAGRTPNPCAAKALNPCAAKALNPCTAKNPCAATNPCNPCGGNPCGAAANPCGGNPCNPCGGAGSVDPARFVQPDGVSLASGSRAELVARGQALWADGSLSTNGASCATCHGQSYRQMQPTFAEPYPHRVAMVEALSGVPEVGAAEMVQFCMLQPMQADPLAWGSPELAALAAYVEHIQPGYEEGAAPALNACNPCAAKNPCNPCAAKNPCNPCSGRNPCNPCGGG